jgi:nicotinamide mononucleotide transporter
VNDLNNGVPLWRRILLCLSGISAFSNVLYVVLVIKGKISSFFWGIAGAILYGIYAFAFGYVGDAQLNIFFFLPMQFLGIYSWSKQMNTEATTRVRSLTPIGWLVMISLCAGLSAMFFYEIPAFAKALVGEYGFENILVAHIFDACTNAISVVGQFLLIFCYWEQYILWLCTNIMGIIMYSGK